ncbi:MAG: endonuclease/exonuclease/phosphatase family protein [Deltaproteobacteria bacterium]|jgi:endonuclease/exonuclease/phosphatase family metal-dependent hydrolase|nr:endonuclease/exonuclease/phosphatase family protein [Deltaproteobacteria bacterium]MBW2535505.1 endonuclease/exonuclease/phosphatase family protein [Deltaproteobacteria bacterium]
MRIRVITYNVHKCIGGVDRRYQPDRVGDIIAHYRPDLALLQEVTSGVKRLRGHRQVDLLGTRLGMRHRAYVPNVHYPRGGEYGNAVLGIHPIVDLRNIDLTIPPKKRRGVLHVRTRIGMGSGRRVTLHVFNLHLGLSGIERKMQLRRFLESQPFARLDQRAPIVLAGDFNDLWGTLGRKLLVPAGFRGLRRPIRTFPAFAPVRALDSIYLRGPVRFVRVFRSRLLLAKHASDHLPLIADLEVS